MARPRPGGRRPPTPREVRIAAIKEGLKAYHQCARNAGCGKGKKRATKEKANIALINLPAFKQKARARRARRPQQPRSDSTGRFTIRPTTRVVGRRLRTRPGTVPLQTRPGMVPLQTRPGMVPLQTRPGMAPLPTFPAPRT